MRAYCGTANEKSFNENLHRNVFERNEMQRNKYEHSHGHTLW